MAQAIGQWAVDALYESLARPSGGRTLSASVTARAFGSDVASLLLSTHAPLVKGSGRQASRWLSSVDRLGHATWLLLMAARGAHDENGWARAAEQPDAHERSVLERVRAVMLACALLERSDHLRPSYRAAMSRAHTTPEWLWSLLADALSLQAERAREGERATKRDLGHELEVSGKAVGQPLSWSQPELVFKYLDLHADDPTGGGVDKLALRWLLALIGLSNETLHELRCHAAENAAHFDRLAATSDAARAAVEA